MLEPVLTVTANSALDRVILVPDFAFGKTVVATGCTLAMAGKPADASFVLAELGISSHATGFYAGDNGRIMINMLESAGVNCSFLPVAGETRVNIVIVKEGTGQQATATVPSLKPTLDDGEKLLTHVKELLPGRKWLVLGGSLPAGIAPDFYIRLIKAAKEAGVKVLLDASGETLKNALPALPNIVKPNQIELGAAIGRTLDSVPTVVDAARELTRRGIEIVCVTMGEFGSVCVSGNDAWQVPPVPVKVLNPTGAGDAFSAGLVKGLLESNSLPEALRWATAAATAVVLTLGTAECHKPDVLRLLPQVIINKIS